MDIFSGLKNFLKPTPLVTDNLVFRLHYKWTCAVLICFSILVTARQYIGDPIDCVPAAKELVPPAMLDTFCWVHGTFSVPSSWTKDVGPNGIVYPGVDKHVKGDPIVRHSYYQWVCFVLFFQAMLFYFGRLFWKTTEGGLMKSIILGLDSPILPQESRAKNQRLLADYLCNTLSHHNPYFYCFVLGEAFNFANVVGQMFLMDAFLGYNFASYGAEVAAFDSWGTATRNDAAVQYDPMVRVFPRLAKCNFYLVGSGGDNMKMDTLCLLPVNVINEKIYVFLWFHFIVLAAISGVTLGYRMVVVFWRPARFLVTKTRAKLANVRDLSVVVDRCSLGDWFVLDLLAKNMDALNFRDLVKDLALRLEGKALVGDRADV